MRAKGKVNSPGPDPYVRHHLAALDTGRLLELRQKRGQPLLLQKVPHDHVVDLVLLLGFVLFADAALVSQHEGPAGPELKRRTPGAQLVAGGVALLGTGRVTGDVVQIPRHQRRQSGRVALAVGRGVALQPVANVPHVQLVFQLKLHHHHVGQLLQLGVKVELVVALGHDAGLNQPLFVFRLAQAFVDVGAVHLELDGGEIGARGLDLFVLLLARPVQDLRRLLQRVAVGPGEEQQQLAQAANKDLAVAQGSAQDPGGPLLHGPGRRPTGWGRAAVRPWSPLPDGHRGGDRRRAVIVGHQVIPDQGDGQQRAAEHNHQPQPQGLAGRIEAHLANVPRSGRSRP